jgi:hypothetical protein
MLATLVALIDRRGRRVPLLYGRRTKKMLLRKKLMVLMGTALMMVMMLALASPAFATHCVNDHKPQGAGTEAFEHNGGRAGFVDISQFGGPKVDVFLHPSRGSLPEGAHESQGWSELEF